METHQANMKTLDTLFQSCMAKEESPNIVAPLFSASQAHKSKTQAVVSDIEREFGQFGLKSVHREVDEFLL